MVGTLIALAACGVEPRHTPTIEGVALLRGAESWAIQLQHVHLPDAADALVRAPVDMVVLEPTRSIRGLEREPIADLVSRVHASPGPHLATKRCVAYLNIGQAEDYRSYWIEGAWSAPGIDTPGSPEFILGLDPDGWEGNYPVAFWDRRWQSELFGDSEALLDQILADGFDGVYLDWVLGCAHPRVVEAAAAAGVDPLTEMVALVARLRRYAHARHPLFVFIAQNGLALAELRPEFVDVVDAFSQEDLSFAGSATSHWGDADAGGLAAPATGPYSTDELGRRLATLLDRGRPVFTLDYAVEPSHIEQAAARSRALGLRPFVSQAPLDRLPQHLSGGVARPR